ncbi:MAG: Gram-negative bacterial tonB protein [Hydrocarboniphaga sp.]|uniref:energy transducer TonB n=1 Tax=Hydrocarboniphaga sp. TaxID=2033016 RepID=UPI00261FEF6D|nr:energy transducer TonB [Hydrocarboniphaga sp.]MDB5971962.1 Gram-negative bacterial tonB protein [Hydrocarboniphaga sp.]
MDFSNKPQTSRRMYSIGAVVLFHMLLIYGLVNGLARKAIELLPPPIETKILDEVKTDEPPPPPPPPPKLDIPPPPFIPPPEINIAAAPRANTITTTTVAPPPAAAPAPRPSGVSKAPVVRAKACKEPDYPAVSERLGEAGTVTLQLLVGLDGKVTDSKIQASSGFERLDKAAVAGLSRCKFEPGTVDGVPTPAWAQIKYTFRTTR